MLKQLIPLAGLALCIGLISSVSHQIHSNRVSNITSTTSLKTPPTTVQATSAFGSIASPTSRSTYDVRSRPARTSYSVRATNPQATDVRLEIHLAKREVLVYQGERTIKRYPIGIGRVGWETPTGSFRVQQMFKDPTWISPFTGERIPGGDPKNPMREYWIGFWTDGTNWIGFHGTLNTATIGKAASYGCIHMYDQDLAELYRQINLGTLVTVLQ